jgi:hypothetical protein
MEQVMSGFLIAAKLVAAFCIAATFMAGCALVQTSGISSQIAIGWVLIIASIIVMGTTVRFWAAGFFGFIAYGALRCLGATLFASSVRVSPFYMLSLAASLFAMSTLSNLGQVVIGVAELRTLYGTGHGRSKAPELEIAHARLVVNAAICVTSFLVEVWQQEVKSRRS